MSTSTASGASAVPPVRDEPAAPATPPTELLLERLAGRFQVHELRRDDASRTYLDTSDRRLAAAGMLLFAVATGDRGGRRLVLERGDTETVEQDGSGIGWPARLDTVPDGPVRRAVAKPVGIRSLLPYAEIQVATTSYAVLNGDGKTVTRVHRAQGRLADRALPDRVQVERLRGYDGEAAWVGRRLRLPADSAGGPTWADALAAVPVPGQPAAPIARMTADEPAPTALAGALLDNLAQIEASVDGIRRDLDIEYLHDFRVAVRRTRSVLKLLGDLLPEGLADWAGTEFRWLGQVTTPGRDLDVYVEELPALARDLARPTDLDDFADHVRAKRQHAYTALRRTLRSARFTTLLERWRSELEAILASPAAESAGPTLTASELADQRLHRTFRKVARRAKAIGPDSVSDEIHDLRKACKELRYLLEMFKPLCDPKAYRSVTTDFKALQDVLGDFQDGEVQAAALRDFAEEMLSGKTASAPTLLAMGELAAQFDERQRAARQKLLDQHLTHLGRSVARHLDHVVAKREQS